LLYAFDEGLGERVYNKLGDGSDLIAPAWMKVLQIRALSWPQWEELGSSSGLKDVFLNFLGFMPLGFLLIATLSRLEGIGSRHVLLATLLIAFSFSLGIEIVQVWIPSRDSSLLDLNLNTLGGLMGALLFRLIHNRTWQPS
jgi:glycopeptide antibiotics resistance protein